MPESHVQAAADRLRAGGLVAFPTETVYGLGADACNPLAIRRIYAAKGRPTGHPLIVHLPADADLSAWTVWTDRGQALADAFWPGPLTLVLPRTRRVLDEVTGGLDTVGVRIPAHEMAQQLLTAFGGGVAAPSANRFGHVSPTTAQHVESELDQSVLVLDGGPCAVGIESTIVDLSGEQPALLRPGGIPTEEIAAIIGPLGCSATPAPGTLPRHYAPRTALRLTADPEAEAARFQAMGLSVEVLPAGTPADHAHRLYAELRRLDDLGVDVLVAERSPHQGLGLAINDRLARAARGAPGFPQGEDPRESGD